MDIIMVRYIHVYVKVCILYVYAHRNRFWNSAVTVTVPSRGTRVLVPQTRNLGRRFGGGATTLKASSRVAAGKLDQHVVASGELWSTVCK